MRRVVYTCVFADFDRVFPPLVPEAGIDYVLFTDRGDRRVAGWRTRVVDPAGFGSPRAANRHFKFFPHRLFPDHDASLYMDGNIRAIGPLSHLFDRLDRSGADILVPRHPWRTRVGDEIEAAIRLDLVADPDRIREEYRVLCADGFVDDGDLTENNLLLRRHAAPALDAAMTLWWHYVATYAGRDQISFLHVLRKTGLKREVLDLRVREPNPYVHLYPHRGKLGGRMRALRDWNLYLQARAVEGVRFRLAQRGVEAVLRSLRRFHPS